ncbi:hypothetical protein Ddye_021103 [Dipteronia dyeriana]|uniref:Uncharacterized protein n=1 Tax=Dipteronia dyeriana TaxID=168575 RepID=A0AAD9U1T7_9ROSI|nr:hypothetical protein Ddye_021103 [Dipteronia dyeriana]
MSEEASEEGIKDVDRCLVGRVLSGKKVHRTPILGESKLTTQEELFTSPLLKTLFSSLRNLKSPNLYCPLKNLPKDGSGQLERVINYGLLVEFPVLFTN